VGGSSYRGEKGANREPGSIKRAKKKKLLQLLSQKCDGGCTKSECLHGAQGMSFHKS